MEKEKNCVESDILAVANNGDSWFGILNSIFLFRNGIRIWDIYFSRYNLCSLGNYHCNNCNSSTHAIHIMAELLPKIFENV